VVSRKVKEDRVTIAANKLRNEVKINNRQNKTWNDRTKFIPRENPNNNFNSKIIPRENPNNFNNNNNNLSKNIGRSEVNSTKILMKK
jgi:hypothetical protein